MEIIFCNFAVTVNFDSFEMASNLNCDLNNTVIAVIIMAIIVINIIIVIQTKSSGVVQTIINSNMKVKIN